MSRDDARMTGRVNAACLGKVAAALEEMVRSGTARAAVVIAAAPRTLADLRQALPADAKARILAEIDKDLTKLPLAEIESHGAAALQPAVWNAHCFLVGRHT